MRIETNMIRTSKNEGPKVHNILAKLKGEGYNVWLISANVAWTIQFTSLT